MKKRTPQVNCLCRAYPFIHRIGGGKCSGAEWCESYREIDGSGCDACPCNNTGESGCRGSRSGQCDVVGGLESHEYCTGFQEHLHYQPEIRLPVDMNTHFAAQMVDDRYGSF